jgi:tRNA pseudouridine55 synthase
MDGIIVVDKPAGITSFDVVRKIRQKLKIKKVGHCGTLDPLATGILVILLGRHTKLFSSFSNFDKGYLASLKLGLSTDSGDCQGKVLRECDIGDVSLPKVEGIFKEFIGEFNQLPPMFSALKYKGKKLYEWARQDIEVPRQRRRVKIYDLQILNSHLPYIDFYVKCSKGTYVRTLVDDIGFRLGCGACLTGLRRVALGPFSIEEAVILDKIDESHIRHWPS